MHPMYIEIPDCLKPYGLAVYYDGIEELRYYCDGFKVMAVGD